MRRRAFLLAMAAGLALIGAPLAADAQSQTGTIRQLKFMSGPQGGSWVPLAGAIAELVQKQAPGLQVTVLPGAGIANVKALQGGRAELGFGNANSTADGYAGRAPFDQATRDVLNVVTLYDQYFQLVVPADSGIRTVADLKGKRLATQPRGNTGEQITRELLEVNGLAYDDLAKVHFVSYTDAVELIKNRQADAFGLITTIPASAVLDLATSRPVRLLSIDEQALAKLKAKNSGYGTLRVPRGTYPGQESDAVTVGTYTHVVANAGVPEDVIYQVTRTIVESRDQLAIVVSAMRGRSLDAMAQDVGVPFHPGAKRYFDEAAKK